MEAEPLKDPYIPWRKDVIDCFRLNELFSFVLYVHVFFASSLVPFLFISRLQHLYFCYFGHLLSLLSPLLS